MSGSGPGHYDFFLVLFTLLFPASPLLGDLENAQIASRLRRGGLAARGAGVLFSLPRCRCDGGEESGFRTNRDTAGLHFPAQGIAFLQGDPSLGVCAPNQRRIEHVASTASGCGRKVSRGASLGRRPAGKLISIKGNSSGSKRPDRESQCERLEQLARAVETRTMAFVSIPPPI